MKNLTKGQITISTLYGVLALVSAIATPVIWIESRIGGVQDETDKVNTKTEVVATRVDGIDGRLNRMEDKIDLLLQKSNIKYMENYQQ